MKSPNLIEELELVLKQKNLSPENAARYIGCSFKQVYRWINGISMPTSLYREAIQRGIKRMKKLSTVNMNSIIQDRELFKKLTKVITLEEKNQLLNFSRDYFDYRECLKKLAEKYGIPIKEDKEK